jgi:hypothetical protein
MVAYNLKLPKLSQIYPIFHVSQVKKVVDSKYLVTHSLPSELSALQVPEQILGCLVESKLSCKCL